MNNEALIRLSFFFGTLVVMSVLEVMSPRRKLTTSKPVRWLGNLGIVLIDTVTLRVICPLLAIELSLIAQEKQWGLLNNYNMPGWVEVVIGVLILDLIIYLQHLMFHTVPVLWRLHMMHHADLDIDLTTEPLGFDLKNKPVFSIDCLKVIRLSLVVEKPEIPTPPFSKSTL